MFSGVIGFEKLYKRFQNELPFHCLPSDFIDTWCMEKIEHALFSLNPDLQHLEPSLILVQIAEIQKVRCRIKKASVFPKLIRSKVKI